MVSSFYRMLVGKKLKLDDAGIVGQAEQLWRHFDRYCAGDGQIVTRSPENKRREPVWSAILMWR